MRWGETENSQTSISTLPCSEKLHASFDLNLEQLAMTLSIKLLGHFREFKAQARGEQGNNQHSNRIGGMNTATTTHCAPSSRLNAGGAVLPATEPYHV